MSRYIVRFMKDVLGTNGHEAEICQRCLEVEAPNACSAAETAKLQFCACEELQSWSIHADRIEVKAADFPS
ncbi:hypothetical protein BH11PSE4_BH11PSE4_10440 [soil metagenome]